MAAALGTGQRYKTLAMPAGIAAVFPLASHDPPIYGQILKCRFILVYAALKSSSSSALPTQRAF
jgi:hypothetical protein